MNMNTRFRLVARGGPGLCCDAEGVALGAVALIEKSGEAWNVRSIEELSSVLQIAYGQQSPEGVAKCYRGLQRAARWLEADDLAYAALEAVMIGLPDLSSDGVAKLAASAGLSKDAAWENEPRVPAGQTGGGQWTTGGDGGATPAPEPQREPTVERPRRADNAAARRQGDKERRPPLLDDGVYHPAADHPALILTGGGAEGEPGEGAGGEPPARDPMTLDQMFPGLKDKPTLAIVAPIDRFLGFSEAADGANLDVTLGEYSKLIRDIHAVDPNWVDEELYPPGGVAGLSWQARNNLLNRLRMVRAVAYYKIRHDPQPLQVETIRFLQAAVDDAFTKALELEKRGLLPTKVPRELAIGNEVDGIVRKDLKDLFEIYGLQTGPHQSIAINNRDQSAEDKTYTRPDARVANLSIDWTLSFKTADTKQIRGFFAGVSHPSAVVIIRPSRFKVSTYLIPRIGKRSTRMSKLDCAKLAPQDIGETLDYLSFMMLYSPTFVDRTGYFPWRNLDNTFGIFNIGINSLRPVLGDDLANKLGDMSKRMRLLFEADPEDRTGEATQGRAIIREMIDLLEARWKAAD